MPIRAGPVVPVFLLRSRPFFYPQLDLSCFLDAVYRGNGGHIEYFLMAAFFLPPLY